MHWWTCQMFDTSYSKSFNISIYFTFVLCGELHYNENVFIMMKFASLVALEVNKVATSNGAGDESSSKWRYFCFSVREARVQCIPVTLHTVNIPFSERGILHFYKVNAKCLDMIKVLPWWRHQLETFSALLAICAGNSPVTGEFPAQRPVTRSFGVFFDLRLTWINGWVKTIVRLVIWDAIVPIMTSP